VLVIGNGESRKDIDIDLLNYTKIGCNAIYRDFKVDHLVCVDKPMLKEAVDSDYNVNSKIYTRKPYVGSERPDDPVHWGSGPYAVLLAAKLTTDDIHLLGFDLYSTDNKVNNIYKDTVNYSLAHNSAVDPRYWIYQIGKVFECFPNTNFIIHNNNFELPKAWKKTNAMVDNVIKL
jgi:hypothetical protein